MMVPAAMSEAQAHFPASGLVVRDVDVPHPSSVGGVAAGPALQLRVDATIGTTHVDRLALRMERHTPRPCNASVTDA